MREKTNGFAAMLLTVCTLLVGEARGAGLVISPLTLSDGLYGANYNPQTFKVTGGKSPYTFSLSAGNLPPGMSLSQDGVLSGTPAAAGAYSFTITVQDHTKGPGMQTATQTYTLNIDQASLTITANNATMTYGSAMPALTVSYKGFVNGDNAGSLTTPPTVTTMAVASSQPGKYPITASGAVDGNYNISYNPGTLTIQGVTLHVTAQAQTKVYGAADPTLTYTVSGLPNGDNTSLFTGSLSRAPGENVGSYAITQGSLSAGPNFGINFTGNFLTITAASQQISWSQDLLVGCSSATHLTLSATANSGLPVTYSVADPNVATVSGNVLTLVAPGTTIVTANQAGDANHAPAPAVTDTVVYQPTSLINQHWSDVIFFDNSSGDFVGWQWYKNGDSIPGATEPYYSESPALNGQYFVIAANKDGQHVQSCTLTITGDTVLPGGIKVYPNPAKVGAAVTVTTNYPASALQGAVLEVIDVNGRVRQQITTVQPAMQVTMPVQTGIYVINLVLAGGSKASTNVLVQ